MCELTYCFPSPSLQFGQVQATRRKRGLAGLELLPADAEESFITTSMVPSAGVGEESCPLEVVGAGATVTSWVACGAPVVTTCHLVGSLGSCWSCWPRDEAAKGRAHSLKICVLRMYGKYQQTYDLSSRGKNRLRLLGNGWYCLLSSKGLKARCRYHLNIAQSRYVLDWKSLKQIRTSLHPGQPGEAGCRNHC